jgi:regulator of sigma E protease
MSYVLAFIGFAALVILHELGHFTAAKAVGMRVERFSLFFGPLLFKVRRGETEYGIGPIPLGGYVKITGMNPHEELPPEVAARGYFRQPVWKRIVVIAAGPLVNLVLAFLIIWIVLLAHGESVTTSRVAPGGLKAPASVYLRPGDEILSVDGVRGSAQKIALAIDRHRCRGRVSDGCVAATPATVAIDRGGRMLTLRMRPRYDATTGIRRMRLGFSYAVGNRGVGPLRAASLSVSGMWSVTRQTAGVFGRIFSAKERKKLNSVVGGYKVTQKEFATDTTQAFVVLAFISLSLALVNLFPFLPLDGGHIFWALAEKVRRRPIPFTVMERAGFVGFALVLMLFAIGLQNDINHIRNGGFKVR